MQFSTVNPANDQVLKKYLFHSDSERHEMLARLQASYQEWTNSQICERQKFLLILSELLLKYKEALAQQISLEMGKALVESYAEVEKSASAVKYYANHAEELLFPDFVSKQGDITNASQGQVKAETQTQIQLASSGIILAIMPWNFPLWQLIRCAIPSFLLGNVVLLKHSEITAGVAELIVSLMNEAYDKLGGKGKLIENLRWTHSQTETLISDRRIKAVSFTGSLRGGSQVAALAGKYLKKSVMELGGSDPYLVLSDADLDQATELCANSRLLNAGQSCVAAKRFFVHESLYSDFLHLMKIKFEKMRIGDPLSLETQMGPLAHLRFKEQLLLQVKELKGKCFYQRSEFSSSGAFFSPRVFEMETQSELWIEELFGPVACVWKFREESEALAQANNTIFGLGAAVFSQDLNRAKKIASQLECGMVAINDMVKSDVRLPFGGIKDSGYGRELSKQGLQEFANIKTIG